MGIYELGISPKDTQKFAEEVCFDYNPVHKVGNNPQYIPGDYLSLTYFNFLKKLPDALAITFGGKRGIFPDEIMNLSFKNISTENAGLVLTIEPTISIKFEGYSLDNAFLIKDNNNSKLNEFFPKFDYKTAQFAKQYCLISGDLSNGLLQQILIHEQFERTNNTILLYRGSSFELYSGINRLKKNESLERVLCDVKTNIRSNGKSGKIIVSYFLVNTSTGNKVGVLQKDLACYNLEPKQL